MSLKIEIKDYNRSDYCDAIQDLLDWCSNSDFVFRLVSGKRSFEEQTELFKKGRSDLKVKTATNGGADNIEEKGTSWYYKRGSNTVTDSNQCVTYAFCGQSYHCYGLAIDLIPPHCDWSTPVADVIKMYKQTGLYDYAKSVGLSFGCDWTRWQDAYHIEETRYKVPNDLQVLMFPTITGKQEGYLGNALCHKGHDCIAWVLSYNNLDLANDEGGTDFDLDGGKNAFGAIALLAAVVFLFLEVLK